LSKNLEAGCLETSAGWLPLLHSGGNQSAQACQHNEHNTHEKQAKEHHDGHALGCQKILEHLLRLRLGIRRLGLMDPLYHRLSQLAPASENCCCYCPYEQEHAEGEQPAESSQAKPQGGSNLRDRAPASVKAHGQHACQGQADDESERKRAQQCSDGTRVNRRTQKTALSWRRHMTTRRGIGSGDYRGRR